MNKRTLLIGLGIFAAVVLGIFVVSTVMKKSTPTPSPTPRPTVVASPQSQVPVTPEVFVVGAAAACNLSFTVAEELVPGLNCVSKELYKNVAANTAGTYTLTGNKLAADFTLVPGDTYIYVISYKNTGTGATAGTVEDTLPAGLTFKDATTGCTYAGATRKVACTIPSVAASGAGQAAIRFTVIATTDKDSITNTAIVKPTTGDQSSCRLTNPIKTPPPSGNPSPSPSTPSSPTPSGSPKLTGDLDCVAKLVYENSSSNSAGQYYLNTQITDTNTLQNGQIVVFNVRLKNKGAASVPDTTITDVLSSNLTYLDGESGCSYDSASRTVTCTVGALPGNTEATRSFRATVAIAGTSSIANTADVFSTNGQRDSCSITVNATGQIVTPPSPVPTALPEAGVFEVTVGTLGVGLLLLIVGALGLLLI